MRLRTGIVSSAMALGVLLLLPGTALGHPTFHTRSFEFDLNLDQHTDWTSSNDDRSQYCDVSWLGQGSQDVAVRIPGDFVPVKAIWDGRHEPIFAVGRRGAISAKIEIQRQGVLTSFSHEQMCGSGGGGPAPPPPAPDCGTRNLTAS